MRFLSFLLLALAAGPAAAQSLREAVDAAWRRSPPANALEAREAEVAARARIAGAWFAEPPSVGVDARTDRLNRNHGSREFEAEVGLPMWLPGQRAALLELAQRERQELDAQRSALRLQLAGEVRARWIALSEAMSEVRVARERLETARRLEQDQRRRLEVGEVARFEANLAEVERLAAEADLAEALAHQRDAHAELELITGLDISAELPPEQPAHEGSATSPERDAAERALAVAQARVRAASAETRAAPELGFFARRERGGFGEAYEDSLGVRFRLPLESGPRRDERIAAAQAGQAQAAAELALVESRLASAGRRAKADLASAEQRRALADARRRLAADNLRLAARARQLGEIDLAALLRARTTAYEAERAAEKARLAVAAAIGRLNQSLGVIP